jgi:hypothetical protein
MTSSTIILVKVVNVVSFETDAEAAKNAAAVAQEEMMKQVGHRHCCGSGDVGRAAVDCDLAGAPLGGTGR